MKKLILIFITYFLVSSICVADDELITQWNAQAIELLKTGNISSPVNKSALYYLARIEKVSPHHEQAKQLRKQISDAYQTLSENNDNANDKKLLRLISTDLKKYSDSERLDESTSSARVQRFLKLNYPSIKSEKLETLESDYSLYKTELVTEAPKKQEADEVIDTTVEVVEETNTIAEENSATEEPEVVTYRPSQEALAWKRKAEERITQAKLSLPINDSALHYLALIENESLTYEVTISLREQIANRYIGLGNYALSNDQTEKGNKWLNIGKHIQNVDTNNTSFTTTLESVNAFNRGEITVTKVKSTTKDTTSHNNKLLSIPEQKPKYQLFSQTLEVSVDNSDWLNPFDKKRKTSNKKKVELNINEDIKPSDNKVVDSKDTDIKPNLSLAQESKVQELYDLAQIDIRNNRLTKPSHRNAYKKLLTIESIQEDNVRAIQLRKDIYNAYINLIRTAISAGLYEKANIWLDSAEQVLPNQDETLQLRQQLND